MGGNGMTTPRDPVEGQGVGTARADAAFSHVPRARRCADSAPRPVPATGGMESNHAASVAAGGRLGGRLGGRGTGRALLPCDALSS